MTYANMSGRSMNDALAMFLEQGLIIYSKGENTLSETIRSLKQERNETRGIERRKDGQSTA